MPVLLALSILAFVAFLWATISIAKFVRRARRRRKRAAEAKMSKAAPLSDTSLSAPGGSPLDSSAVAETLPPPASPSSPASPEPAGERVLSVAAELHGAEPQLPPRLRNFPTRLGNHPVGTGTPDDPQPAWNPFGKELADFSDPTPTRRFSTTRVRHKDDR